jgi:hypothetical protein
MENAMSEEPEESDDLDWRGIMETLTGGNAVEIPFDTEKEAGRRAKQIAKRAERNGLTVDVQRTATTLRVEPKGAAGAQAAPAAPARSDEEREAREERRQERTQRREAAKAERSAAREGQ